MSDVDYGSLTAFAMTGGIPRVQSWQVVRLCAAEHLLNSEGQRFLVDFGYENAVEKARAVWERRKAGR